MNTSLRPLVRAASLAALTAAVGGILTLPAAAAAAPGTTLGAAAASTAAPYQPAGGAAQQEPYCTALTTVYNQFVCVEEVENGEWGRG
ncbi:hypothetical protein [Actinomadura kijaniata]|uniref:hypothetical protein n=1 Tax=Actinomadura kijaniata TaxID=46161 RepID=UPI0008333245|nr:hypothetical protein [Actinomadura kijaniata]